jgi:hypothetical protein
MIDMWHSAIFPRAMMFLASAAWPNAPITSSQELVPQRAVVEYADFGELRVEATEPAGKLPKLLISENLSGHSIFSTNVGTQLVRPESGASKTILRFVVVDGPHPQSPMVLAIAMSPGVSDCGYKAVVVGEISQTKHRMAVLTPDPVDASAEDGIYVGNLGNHEGFGLAVWNFIWAEDEAHVDKHQYEVTLYRYEPTQSQFRFVRRLKSKGKYQSGTDALAELGLHYRNLMRDIPVLAC